MLEPDERVLLVSYCGDHSVAVCPRCNEAVEAQQLGVDLIGGRRDFCPSCRTDLSAVLHLHLRDCTFLRVQAREARERAQQVCDGAQAAVKESQRLQDRADVLAREAEATRDESREVKRGGP